MVVQISGFDSLNAATNHRTVLRSINDDFDKKPEVGPGMSG